MDKILLEAKGIFTRALFSSYVKNPAKFIFYYQKYCRFYKDEQNHRALAGDY